jgi:hypothetical protein
MMRRKKEDRSDMKRTVGSKGTATHVNSEHHNSRNNNQTDTLKETNKKGDVSVKKGEGIEKEG